MGGPHAAITGPMIDTGMALHAAALIAAESVPASSHSPRPIMIYILPYLLLWHRNCCWRGSFFLCCEKKCFVEIVCRGDSPLLAVERRGWWNFLLTVLEWCSELNWEENDSGAEFKCLHLYVCHMALLIRLIRHLVEIRQFVKLFWECELWTHADQSSFRDVCVVTVFRGIADYATCHHIDLYHCLIIEELCRNKFSSYLW